MRNPDFKNISDEELVDLYVSLQRNIYFDEIYERYAQKICRKCFSFVADRAKAEDMTHDIFLKVITKVGTFKKTARFSTWLYSITYNHCMDSIRKEKRSREEAIDENIEFVEEVIDQELMAMQSEGLRKSFEKITPQEKAIILMKYQDNFTIEDIADSLKISESAVKMRLMRTKDKIRKHYLEHLALVSLLVLKLIMFLKNT